MELITDKELMIKVRDGDVDQLSHLFKRHHVKLFNYFLRMTGKRVQSEDMVQELFMRMLKYRQSYQAQGSFQTWMYRIARNLVVDYYRARNDGATDIELNHMLSNDPDPDRAYEQRQEAAILQKALSMLSPDKREAIVLSRFHQMKYKEIAEIQHCGEGTIKVKVFRALKELSQIYYQLTGIK